MSSDIGLPKVGPTPATSTVSSIPQKRAQDEDYYPAVSSPLRPDHKPSVDAQADEASQALRSKPTRTKKESLKKREARGDSAAAATPDSRSAAAVPSQADIGPIRYKLPPPKLLDFEPTQGLLLSPHHTIITYNGDRVEFLEPTDFIRNKKSYRYAHCIADPRFTSSNYYRSTDSDPCGPRLSFEDSATNVYFDKSGRHVSTDKGFRMARANVGVREGRWYYECKITQGVKKSTEDGAKPRGGQHVRMGWARREAPLDAPVGFDAYSYGIRDVAGEKVFMSRPKDFFPAGEGIQEGDVVGLEIELPSEHLHKKVVTGFYNPAVDSADNEVPPATEATNIVRDGNFLRFKAHLYLEKTDYAPQKELEDLMNPSPTTSTGLEAQNPNHPIPSLRTLPNSCIKVYKNGVLMGTAFENLLGFLPPASKPANHPHLDARDRDDGSLGYYPAVSVFRGGAAEVNFGPDFWYPPPGYTSDSSAGLETSAKPPKPIHAMSERYRDSIAEDVVHDIVDEVYFWTLDGHKAKDEKPVGIDGSQAGPMFSRDDSRDFGHDA